MQLLTLNLQRLQHDDYLQLVACKLYLEKVLYIFYGSTFRGEK